MDNNATLVAYGLKVKVEFVGASHIPGCVVVRFAEREFHVSAWAVEVHNEG